MDDVQQPCACPLACRGNTRLHSGVSDFLHGLLTMLLRYDKGGVGRPSTLAVVTWSASQCERLAKELLCRAGDRWAHVQLVAGTLDQWLSAGYPSDSLLSAAWLHDIGYAPELLDTGMHAVDGAAFLDRAGAPSEIVSLVAFHTGAEFEAEERGLVDNLLQFERPPQDHLDVLILADLLSGPTGQPLTVEERLDEIPGRYEPQHPVYRAVQRSRPYLEECAARAAAAVGYPM